MKHADPIALAQAGRPSLKLDEFLVGVNGLVVTGQPALPACARVGRVLGTVKQSLQMAVGDFVNWLEATYPDEASQIIDAEIFGDDRSVGVWSWVAEKVPLDVRRLQDLSFTHHQIVSGLEPAQQAQLLALAIDRQWSATDLKAALKDAGITRKTKPVTWWLEVQCRDRADREALTIRLRQEGRTCRPKA